MTDRLIERNIRHFGQADTSPFAQPPLVTTFGYCGTNQASINLARKGHSPTDLNEESLDIGTKRIIQGLSDTPAPTEMSDNITHDEFWKAFKIWDEQTTTSPSGRHLGHYKSLLISDGNDDMYTDESPNPSIIIKQVYYQIAMATLYSANTLRRWCHSSTMMLEKVPGNPKINKLRVIHLYEADYNLLLKILWARRLVWHSHTHNQLHEAQAGSRPHHRCSDVVLRKEMNYQYSKFTRTNLATVDNDAKACYDRILCNLAMIISQHFGMSNRACKTHSKTLKAMLFTIRTNGGDSDRFYCHTEDTPIHGSGQGSCASPSLWLHTSAPYC